MKSITALPHDFENLLETNNPSVSVLLIGLLTYSILNTIQIHKILQKQKSGKGFDLLETFSYDTGRMRYTNKQESVDKVGKYQD